jgi:hypothetical protein
MATGLTGFSGYLGKWCTGCGTGQKKSGHGSRYGVGAGRLAGADNPVRVVLEVGHGGDRAVVGLRNNEQANLIKNSLE